LDKAPEAFRTISEVADELEVPKHVLRFWEAKFTQLKPMKRGGGRRYYRPEDVALLRGIRFLLYNDGYTIRGVQKILREHGPRFVMDFRRMADREDGEDAAPARHDIPDVAAEAAQGGRANASFTAPEQERRIPVLDPKALGALLDELETCRRILAAAKQ
jgi:DNA-binding transcriptional MerR regulator